MRRSLGIAATFAAVFLSSGAFAMQNWTLVIHGGAGAMARGTMTPERDAAQRAGLAAALEAGKAVLASGGAALDAVEAAVKVLEDNPGFNAGRGAVFTYEGVNELDAAIMDGRNRAAGAVTGLTRTRNPISAARAVMEKSPHVMLQAPGADRFARERGLDQVDPSYFRTEERWQQLQTMKENTKTGAVFDADMKYGTVGAAAKDMHGNLAAATSTGGLTGKRWGRVGDSPVIGAGTYADNRGCAVSATGSGEFYIRIGVAHEICARMRFGKEDAQTATDAVQDEVKALGGAGGVIAVAPDGTSAFSFNTPGMYRGRATSGGDFAVHIYGDEE
ncbi:beta-aspartyl-peptidase (threonine type) [Sphingosinicella soli]|uniref:Isoaspartyl peptidase n=2 Tax=Sphingosinicella soli TaxID=333708 RepID=A0A7W7F7S7_9SPHN|nr:beta-aspartyl-peptidase (threonine type) [Sphingosinicella soli]